MRDPYFYVNGLLDLGQAQDPVERRALWRQSLTALARANADEGPGPLTGLEPSALARGVQAALASGLADDLEWMAPSAAAVALYELASALPVGHEQRELGRRLLTRMLSGNAETVAVLSARMAQSSAKSIATPAARARIALLLELPIGLGLADGALCLVLISRRDLARDWIDRASTGSLPSRRLAARILERAAREAARKAASGDLHGLRAFGMEHVAPAWARLLGDRESLVWRHVAVARGLLAKWQEGGVEALETALGPSLTPTEWRRAATSFAALAAVDPDGALQKLGLAMERAKQDAGIGAALVWGLARAAEAEPDVAETILERVIEHDVASAADAVLELRREFGPSAFTDRVCARTVAQLTRGGFRIGDDEGADILAREIILDLEQGGDDEDRLGDRVRRALTAFAESGAPAAFAQGKQLLDLGRTYVAGLSSPQSSRRTSVASLRDLHAALLEHNVVGDLLRLGTNVSDVRTLEERLDALRGDVADWLLAPTEESSPAILMRRLRALLHVADGDTVEAEEGSRAVQTRLRRIARSLLGNPFAFSAPGLRRAQLATLARALDALVRVEGIDVTDVFLLLITDLPTPDDLETLAEASMLPDLEHMLVQYARFDRQMNALGSVTDKLDSLLPPSFRRPPGGVGSFLDAFTDLCNTLVPDASARGEALRISLVRMRGALAAIEAAPSLRALSSGNVDTLTTLEGAVTAVGQILGVARQRFERPPLPGGGHAVSLADAVARVLAGDGPLREETLGRYADDLSHRIPRAMATLATASAFRLLELPQESGGRAPNVSVSVALPSWVPARRTLGGFYVIRPLGAGAVGSVFLVNRLEERHDPEAERFALKVPDYSETAARSLSETEFMQLFREEATALIGLPAQTNLARFVTFDLAARPKPILVMEFVEGATLEREIGAHTLDVPRAFRIFDDILAGLEAMHGVGIAHLDIKPSNVILRGGGAAVLVDFGLSGRKIRPGCATGPYGAPEVWGALEGPTSPLPTDVYAFACLAFETLTGSVLFDAQSEVAMVGMHLAHDGSPQGVQKLAKVPRCEELAEILFSALRRNPADRVSLKRLRDDLRRAAKKLEGVKWPIAL